MSEYLRSTNSDERFLVKARLKMLGYFDFADNIEKKKYTEEEWRDVVPTFLRESNRVSSIIEELIKPLNPTFLELKKSNKQHTSEKTGQNITLYNCLDYINDYVDNVSMTDDQYSNLHINIANELIEELFRKKYISDNQRILLNTGIGVSDGSFDKQILTSMIKQLSRKSDIPETFIKLLEKIIRNGKLNESQPIEKVK